MARAFRSIRRVLVTGGAGFIGSWLVERLLARGDEVVVWDLLTSGKVGNLHPGATFDPVDVGDVAAVERGRLKVGRAFDVVFHLAALSRIQPAIADPQLAHRTNVTGTFNLLKLAKDNGARFVFASSCTAGSSPMLNPYSGSKLIGERYCEFFSQAMGVDCTVCRLFNVYGPREICVGPFATVCGIFERLIAEGKPLMITGNGEQRRDFIHVTDVVAGLVKAGELSEAFAMVDLGSGQSVSVRELAGLFQQLATEKRDVVYLPARGGESQAELADVKAASAVLGRVAWGAITLQDYISLKGVVAARVADG